MLNSSQENLNHQNKITATNCIKELEQMMSNQSLDNSLKPNQMQNQKNLTDPTANHHFRMQSTIPQNHQLYNPNIINQQNFPKFKVTNINNYLDPQNQLNCNPNYENLNPFMKKQLLINQLNANRSNLNISPNVNGLPEPTRKNSPSFNDNNIYANNSAIVSRYCPATSINNTTSTTTNTTAINQQRKDKNELANNSNYLSSINNDLTSIYRPNSQLTISSIKPESNYYSTYTPLSSSSYSANNRSQITAASTLGNNSGNRRQPISALLNDLDDNLVVAYDKSSSIKPTNNNIIDHLKKAKDAEVDYLTNLLVKGMNDSADPEFFGMCFKCNKTIYGDGNGVTALGRLYHVSCFYCDVCNKTLNGVTFYSKDDKKYCEECFLNTLDLCCICSKTILDRVLRAMGNSYHPNCFSCIECKKCLNGTHFTVDYSNNLYCIECFHEKFAPKCSVCKMSIVPENNKLETVRIVALDRCFHFECYRCEDCNILLSSEKDGKGCYPMDDHILCKECNNKRFEKYLTESNKQNL